RIPFVLIDQEGQPIGPSLLNKDRRALCDVADLVELIGATRLYEITGHFGAPEFGLAKLLWFRRTAPDAWRRAATILQLHDWFIYRLSGVTASEPSSAAMSQMLEVAEGRWATEMLDALGLASSYFPELHKAGTQVGGLLDTVAETTGLPRGLPVHVGGGDTHLSAISTGPWDPEVPVLVAGTTAPVHVALEFIPPVDDRFPLLLSEHALPGRWTLESNAGATGGIVGRIVDLAEMTGASLEEALVSRGFVLERTPDAPLTVISGNPFFGPEGWAAVARPTIFGLRREHSGADVFAAGLQGGGYAVRSILSTLVARLRTPPPCLRMTGGMSTSPRWCQTIAHATGTEVRVRPLDEVAGLAGAALVVGEDLVNATSQIEEQIYLPSAFTTSWSDEEFETYLELYSLASRRSTEEDVTADACAR
ncbi:MAG TPA: FGGY family carbohydrate kinase, partial [Acidimicrobiales bacterium]|nr:FGGY family carbohydrate kinase [Acidimicrobiales bacterium]